MYVPEAFAVIEPAQIAAMLRQIRLVTLVTHGAQGLFASHLPMIHDPGRGVLEGHLALANPHRNASGGGEALVIASLTDAYVSPSFYPSKAEHGRAVPTWNYEVVHVYGRIVWRGDSGWLRANVTALTNRFEATRSAPWAVNDAPDDHIERLLRTVIGIELRIDRIEAKRKLSQNRSDSDRAGVIAGLSKSEQQSDRNLAAAMLSKP